MTSQTVRTRKGVDTFAIPEVVMSLAGGSRRAPEDLRWLPPAQAIALVGMLLVVELRELVEGALHHRPVGEVLAPKLDFLDQVLTEEAASKTAKHVTMRTQLARFPFVKGLDVFDFSYQPALDKKQIQTLSTCHFIEHGENLVILGAPDPAT
jgi:hypothetical protein